MFFELILAAALGAPPPPSAPVVTIRAPAPRKQEDDQSRWDPVSSYEVRTLLGWKVLISKKFLGSNGGLADRVLIHLQDHLSRITHRLPARAVAKLKQIPIWVEEKHPKHPCMCYHVSAEW